MMRKTADRASIIESQGNQEPRQDQPYLYEEFVDTGGIDVKVYTVGLDRYYAEVRRAPSVEPSVTRDPVTGKDSKRKPTTLLDHEVAMVQEVVRLTGQELCGIDLLRRRDESATFVCDVNGFSTTMAKQWATEVTRYFEKRAQEIPVV